MYQKSFNTMEAKLWELHIENYYSILYTDGNTDWDGHTDRLIPTFPPPPPQITFISQGYNY